MKYLLLVPLFALCGCTVKLGKTEFTLKPVMVGVHVGQNVQVEDEETPPVRITEK